MRVEMDGMRRRWEMVKPGMAIRPTFDAGERAGEGGDRDVCCDGSGDGGSFVRVWLSS